MTSYRYDFETATDRSFNHDELALCKERIEKFCNTPNEVDKWLFDLKNKEWESSASLLLSCMPNVEKIQIKEYKQSSLNSFDRVLQRAATLQSQGSNSPLALSRLTFVHGSFDIWTSLTRLMPFLRLKSVRTAEFETTFDDSSRCVEMPTLELENLVLSTVVDGESSLLEGFLSNFKRLKSFRLREDGSRDPYYNSNPHTLDEAISSLKHCLEELEIDQHLRVPEDPPWISSLADFQKLSKISLNAYVLFKPNHKPRRKNIDVLPPTLKTLELFNYDQYAVDQLLQILQSRQETVPKLVHIQLKRRVVDQRNKTLLARFEEAVGDLKEECNDAAIVLEFFEEQTVRAVDNRSTIWSRIE